MSIEAIAWDIDGTLIDSEPLHQEVLVTVCSRYRVDLSEFAPDWFVGVHIHDVWNALRAGLPATLTSEEWVEETTRLYLERSRHLLPMPGAVETVIALSTMGLRQVCVSNSTRAVVNENIKVLGIEQYIDFSVSLDEVSAGKPDPEPYCFACEAMGLAPELAAAIEDSMTGARSARYAGLFVIGFGDREPLLGEVHAQVRSLSHIVDVLPGRNHHVKWAHGGQPSSCDRAEFNTIPVQE